MRTPQHEQVKQLRSEGVSFRAIAKRLEIPIATVYRWAKGPLVLAGGSEGSGEALPESEAAPSGSVDAPVDLSTAQGIMAEIDEVYSAVSRRGYTASEGAESPDFAETSLKRLRKTSRRPVRGPYQR